MVENMQEKQNKLIEDIINLIKEKGYYAHLDDEDISELSQIHVTENEDYFSTIINIEFF